MSHKSSALAGRFFTTSAIWEVCIFYHSKNSDLFFFFLKKRLYDTKKGLIYLSSLEKAFLKKEHLFRVEAKTGYSQLGQTMVSKETEVRWRGGGQRHVGPCKLGCVKVAQSCPTLFDPMDYTVHGILQARILDWVAIPFPEDLPSSGIRPRSPALQVGSVPAEPPGKSVSWGRECNFYFKSSGKLQMRCSHLHNVKHFIHLKDLSGFCAAPRWPGDAEGSVEK